MATLSSDAHDDRIERALARGDNWDWAHTEDTKYAQAHLYHEMRAILTEAPTTQAVPLPDRTALIELFQQTRCIASPRLERGYGCPVPEEAERMADAVLAAQGEVEWEYAVSDPAHDFAYMEIAGKPTPGAKAMRRRPAGPWTKVQS